jgi:hypothetical protein
MVAYKGERPRKNVWHPRGDGDDNRALYVNKGAKKAGLYQEPELYKRQCWR